ncbi:imelysin family protein [Thalassorhabdomicrobium marinisediminis]|uniref:Peptidase M75 n=1 Tax=Thalassorhabdomicrobium marinisediminis TaxID=2170577 RepID=A0A2T7FSY4_9RHOB|nr:imelysin family protein [Thalassorhabdomicrobium marinisediminis]PVA05276.1 peptidase M75 [Thalassorhabdomicrobium marinisediminis]
MTRHILAAALALTPLAALSAPSTGQIVQEHILPRFEALTETADILAQAAQDDCQPASAPLRAAYHDAFDAWISASHLRFGPTEVDDRAFALAFWPDSRGATPRVLSGLIAAEDPVAMDPEDYAEVSIAGRGFYALEALLFDDRFTGDDHAEYRCTLVQTITADIAQLSADIEQDWRDDYAEVITTPGPDAPYRSDEEALQELLRALSQGLQLTHDSRLGRPLGSFDQPRPMRAEARRSERSARHVRLSLAALRDLALYLAAEDDALAQRLGEQFDTALARLDALADPTFAGVADPQTRLKIEVLQQDVNAIRDTVQQELGPTLGVAAGFNALDGD